MHEIPTFGELWIFSIEFPLYKWISAVLARLCGLSIEGSGRIIALVFFYATIPLLVRLFRLLDRKPQQAALMAATILIAPTYKLWGRSVLIESTALFFSIGYFVGAISYLRGENAPRMQRLRYSLALLCGGLAALVKIPTFAVALGFLVLYVIARIYQCELDWRHGRLKIAGVVALIVSAIVVGKRWIDYTDGIKASGRVTRAFTSAGLKEWNYGTLEQRWSPELWRKFWEYGVQEAVAAFQFLQWGPDRWIRPLHVISILLMVVCVIWFAVRGRRNLPIFLAFLLAFLSGPFVYANLCYEHQYYWSANLWLLIAGILYVIWDSDVWSQSVLKLRSAYRRQEFQRCVPIGLMLLTSVGCGVVTLGAWKYHEYSDWQSWDELRQ